MIYYYSGTGNSRYVAEKLAAGLETDTVRIGRNISSLGFIDSVYGIGFVFPVYAWGVAPAVLEFLDRLPTDEIKRISSGNIPVWMVATCGDEVGQTKEMFSRHLKKHGLSLAGAWSVIMPNTYVLLPGFDVDSHELAQSKIDNSVSRIKEIISDIRSGNFKTDVMKGSWPGIKTAAVYPLFKRWGIDSRKWSKGDMCVKCGKCAGVCPADNIVMTDDGPIWDDHCDSCTACYHICPVHSIRYGNVTRSKGQYRICDYKFQ